MIFNTQPHDLGQMFALEDEYAGLGETFAEFEARYREWPDLFWIYKQGVKIIGAISPQVSQTHLQIASIAVEYDHWGHGIGHQLIEAFGKAGAAYGLPLEVASALNVTGFYQKLGYQPVMLLWYTQNAEAEREFAPSHILDIQQRSKGYRSIYFPCDLPEPILGDLKDLANEDLSMILQKPLRF